MQLIHKSLQKTRKLIINGSQLLMLIPIVLFILMQNYVQLRLQKNRVKKIPDPNALDATFREAEKTFCDHLLETHNFARRMNSKFFTQLKSTGTLAQCDAWIIRVTQQQMLLKERCTNYIAASLRQGNLQELMLIVQNLDHALHHKQECIKIIKQEKQLYDNLIVLEAKRSVVQNKSRGNKVFMASLDIYQQQLGRDVLAYCKQEQTLDMLAKKSLRDVKSAIHKRFTPSV